MPTFDVNVSPFSIPSSIESTSHQLTFVDICPSQNYFTSNPLVSELFYPTIRATLGQWIKSLIFLLYSVHFGDYTQRSLRSSTFNMVSERFTHHPLHPLFLCLLTTHFVWNLVTKQAFIIVNKLKSLVRFCLFVVFNKDQRMWIQEWRSTAHPNYASKKKTWNKMPACFCTYLLLYESISLRMTIKWGQIFKHTCNLTLMTAIWLSLRWRHLRASECCALNSAFGSVAMKTSPTADVELGTESTMNVIWKIQDFNVHTSHGSRGLKVCDTNRWYQRCTC